MSTLVKVGSTVLHNLQEMKTRICSDDQFCQDVMSIGGLAFMVWFMYIAMLPIM